MEIDWQRIWELIRRTGDRCLVVDSKTGRIFVVMDLPSYEKLVFKQSEVKHLTEDEMLDKINRDIAVWQSVQSPADESGVGAEETEFNSGDKISQEDEEDDEYYIESVE